MKTRLPQASRAEAGPLSAWIGGWIVGRAAGTCVGTGRDVFGSSRRLGEPSGRGRSEELPAGVVKEGDSAGRTFGLPMLAFTVAPASPVRGTGRPAGRTGEPVLSKRGLTRSLAAELRSATDGLPR
ncbi:MAG: hypothetical protein M3R22_01840, partial [Pseudomonadota bacterium]|nr:hypothetical protein [Pseudomonadota bacterium]